ncbi:MAG: hypothetical protein ACREFW_05350 [Rhizomicrobium sp.]
MSAAYGEARSERVITKTGTIAEAAGSIAVIVLSIIGLAQTAASTTIVAVTTIVLGAALLAEGGALAGEFSKLTTAPPIAVESALSSVSLQVYGGAIALVLGILAILGISVDILCAAALILVGGVLLLTAGSLPQMRQFSQMNSVGGTQIVERASMSGMAGFQFLNGVAAIVLGILALAGTGTEAVRTLTLVGFLVVGGAMTIAVTAMSGNFMRFFTR